MENKLIYILDDCQHVCHLLSNWLQQYGEVHTFNSSTKFIEQYYSNPPHLCFIDFQIDLNTNGVDVIKQIIDHSIPIILITQKAEQHDQINALKYGAVDILIKPLDKEEVTYKAKNLMSLLQTEKKTNSDYSLSLNEKLFNLEIKTNNTFESIPLTQKEFLIMKKLLKHSEANVSRDQILLYLENHLSQELNSGRVIDYHICNIKKKLGLHKEIIKPVYGVGYRIVA